LRSLDSRHQVFGAFVHRYGSTPVSEDDIVACERQLGCVLPEEYRTFLLEVGHGAGRYYGVWSPQRSVGVVQDLARELAAEEGIEVKPTEPFPLTNQDLREVERKVWEQSKFPWAAAKYPNHGCLPICHQGCCFWSVLVLRGEFTGRVWDVGNHTAHRGQWRPARRPPGRLFRDRSRQKVLPRLPAPATFIEWYIGWIERYLVDLDGA
jgi:hypothetical protein